MDSSIVWKSGFPTIEAGKYCGVFEAAMIRNDDCSAAKKYICQETQYIEQECISHEKCMIFPE